jgi:hypothetical protein
MNEGDDRDGHPFEVLLLAQLVIITVIPLALLGSFGSSVERTGEGETAAVSSVFHR